MKNKNIWLLPTDKPSRLHKYIFEGFALSKESLNWKEAKHIYITNSEEIKEGDWWINLNNNKINSNDLYNLANKAPSCKKIILTIDQDLIKDGVQAIDDEFLEWFVKNPSCDSVEVQTDIKWKSTVYDQPDIEDGYIYKITIPSELRYGEAVTFQIPSGDDFFVTPNTVSENPNDRKYSEEDVKLIFEAGKEYWKTSGGSITIEELLEKINLNNVNKEDKDKTPFEAAVDNYKTFYEGKPLNENIPIDGFFTNEEYSLYTQEEFINKIKTDDEFAKKWDF